MSCLMRGTVKLAALISLLVRCLAVSNGPNAYRCDRGCPSTSAPTCGEDGVTYQNRCLALCQGVVVVKRGNCDSQVQAQVQLLPITGPTASFQETPLSGSSSSSSRGVGIWDSNSVNDSGLDSDNDSEDLIPLQDILRYKQEGYTLIGRASTGSFEPKASFIKRKRRNGAPADPHASAFATTTASASASASTTVSASAGADSNGRSTGPVLMQQQQQPALQAAAVRQTVSGYVYYYSTPEAAKSTLMEAGASSMPTPAAAELLEDAEVAPGYFPGFKAQGVIQEGDDDQFESHPWATAVGAMSASAAAEKAFLLQRMQGNGRRRLSQKWRRALQAMQQGWPQGLQHNQQQQLPHTSPTWHQRQSQSLPQSQEQPHKRPSAVASLFTRCLHGLHAQQAASYIIGKDDRREVPSSKGWPYSAVGQLLYEKGSCTGVLIGPRSVLTAAHCVYSRQRGMWQADIRFIPFRHRAGGKVVEPFGRLKVESITTYSQWVDNPNATDALQYDVAVAQLTTSVGYKTGWLGLAWDKKPYKGKVFSVGYPGDKARGSMWLTTCNVTDYGGADTHFLNACDSWSGQSGSPLWEQRGKDMYYLRAVMSYESCNCCTPDCKCCTGHINGGCKINEMHYKNILKWR